jgi:agmatinase
MSMLTFLGAALLLQILKPSAATGREIVFPPVAAVQHPRFKDGIQGQYRLLTPADDAVSEFEKFQGLTTFANLPWVHCLSSQDDIGKYDIAFLGAPFDTTTTGRPGARFGPTGIRL